MTKFGEKIFKVLISLFWTGRIWAYHFSFLFKFYIFLFNFSSVILISAPKRDEESEESGNLMRYM